MLIRGGHERALLLGATVGLLGAVCHYARVHAFAAVLDEWLVVFCICALTLLTLLIRRGTLWVYRHAADPPIWHHARAKALIEVDGGLVPVEHGPLDPPKA